jgi:tetratricopeptide (TPR) repeat protein
LRYHTIAITALLVSFSIPAFSQQPPPPVAKEDDSAELEQLNKARLLIDAKQPGEALSKHIIKVLDHYSKKYAGFKKEIYCAGNSTESLGYLLKAASEHRESIVLSNTWSTAWFMKAYCHLELGQLAEAKESLKKAIALSPQNAQFLSERGHIFQLEKNWIEAKESFDSAADASGIIADQKEKNTELGRALRGLGYCQVELGNLAEAEKTYQRCLEIDPNDKSAKAEIEYVRGQIQKSKPRK